ncbi:MAG: hypothetical protein J0I47_01860 [Sphingomonas sp.]|uniref:hypothetical protein n=1 Tax=Sphingomonas sp. TaxID=28214 RepID=UPI001AC89FA2|nr:hypothetical protein [Sphingomonas sp.]MBN8806974.1 hypothetical protein [Sphingomonas sp.]
MKSTKTMLGLAFALVPILYCGGLVYYLNAAPRHVEGVLGVPGGATGGMTQQIGPTVLGLGALGVIFAFVFVLKLMRAATGKTPEVAAADSASDEGEPFDADAALARYMARKAAGTIDAPAAPTSEAAVPAPRGFGRKGV